MSSQALSPYQRELAIKNDLNYARLLLSIYREFKKVPDTRGKNASIPLPDILMSLFAIFVLKFPSLLAFEKHLKDGRFANNLLSLFNISKIPSDTQMREVVDQLPRESFHFIFKYLFSVLQRAKKHNIFEFLRRNQKKKKGSRNRPFYLLLIDGVQYFSSEKVHCQNCLVKKKKGKDGEEDGKIYYHQMLVAVMAHPDFNGVIPFPPEGIIKQDGKTKNDCEYNAFKRFISRFREEHPKLDVIVAGDALYAKGDVVKVLKSHGMSFILNSKPKGNKALFDFVDGREKRGGVYYHEEIEMRGKKIKKKVSRKYRYTNQCPLDNASSLELSVNFLEFWETTEWTNSKGKEQIERRHFSWVTDIKLNSSNVAKIAQGGRARWMIENETINTLKNGGYNFGHNYGHGDNNLSINCATLMVLAFMLDQILEAWNKKFKEMLFIAGRKKYLWERLRNIYQLFSFKNWDDFLAGVINSYNDGSLLDSS